MSIWLQEMEIMRVGGNKAMREFFEAQGFPRGLSIEQKYNSQAASLYRERIKQLAEGAAPSSLRPIPIVGFTEASPQPAQNKSRTDSFSGSGTNSRSNSNATREERSPSIGASASGRRDEEDSSPTPSRPRMQGFGSDGGAHVEPPSSSADFFSSLSSSFF